MDIIIEDTFEDPDKYELVAASILRMHHGEVVGALQFVKNMIHVLYTVPLLDGFPSDAMSKLMRVELVLQSWDNDVEKETEESEN